MKIINVEIKRVDSREDTCFMVKVEAWGHEGDSWKEGSLAHQKTWQKVNFTTLEEALSYVHQLHITLKEG